MVAFEEMQQYSQWCLCMYAAHRIHPLLYIKCKSNGLSI